MFMHLHFLAISFIHSYHGLSLQHCCLSVSQAWPCSYFLYFFKGQSQTTPTPPSSGLLVTRIPPGSPCDTCYRYEPGLMSPAPRSPLVSQSPLSRSSLLSLTARSELFSGPAQCQCRAPYMPRASELCPTQYSALAEQVLHLLKIWEWG